MLRVGSLFSGAGLCDLGFHRAGFRHRFFCEVDPYCRSVLARHWPDTPIYNDIRAAHGHELPPIDVLTGGFPCQDVSNSGKRAGITITTRSGLWYEYKRIISETKPRYAVIENVSGLLSRGMEIVLQDLSELGYDAEWQSLSASALGAPHVRNRIFIVAYPHSLRPHSASGVLAPLGRDLAEHFQPGCVADWLGIRINRADRAAIRQAYGGCVLRRVDDGSAGGVDTAGRREPGVGAPPASVHLLSQDERKEWIPRLKALGNGILPRQSYEVACCILIAEGLPVPAWPS